MIGNLSREFLFFLWKNGYFFSAKFAWDWAIFFNFPFLCLLRSKFCVVKGKIAHIFKCRIEKQNCTLRGLRKENRQSIWLFLKVMLYYLHTNEYVHGYVVFNFSQPFLTWKRNDHMFDHLRIWTTWKQCEQEYRKALVADTKDLEMLGKQTKNFLLCLRDQKVVGSSPVASTSWNLWNLKDSKGFLFYLFASIFGLGQH